MTRALKAEFLKLKGSRMLLWTSLVVIGYAVLATVLNVTLIKDPETIKRVASAGGVFKKAVDAGFYDFNWTNQLRVAVQGVSGTWGVMLFAFVTAYVFGREYKEGTEKNLFTLPVRRGSFVAAKMIVVACWALGLTALSMALHVAGLALLGVPGFAWSHVGAAVLDALEVTVLIYLTLPFVAWITMVGRGYLRPMLFTFAAQIVGSGLATTSVSRYYPWNMGVHLVGASWMPVVSSELVPGSWAIAVGLFIVGMFLSLRRAGAQSDAA
jgi:ABC-type transport system involved in multi-copper enzyme maturation permease subunit